MNRCLSEAISPVLFPNRSTQQPVSKSDGQPRTAISPDYLSAQDIARLRLAGLPTTEFRVRERAKAEGWVHIVRPGRGGGRLYSWRHLPEAARADFMERRSELANSVVRATGRPKGIDFFSTHPEVADAVEVILSEQKTAACNVRALLRHLTRLRIAGADAEARSAALARALPEAEFHVPGHIVADVSVDSRTRCDASGDWLLSLSALTIEDW